MIIFYNKLTGEIIGTIEGRIHDEKQLKVNMSVSGVDQKNIDKIVCQWKVSKRWKNEKEEEFVEFEPNHPQKKIFVELDKKPTKVYEYKVINNQLTLK